MEENKNLILALVLSVLVFIGWQHFFEPAPEDLPAPSARQNREQKPVERTAQAPGLPHASVPKDLPPSPRVRIEAPQLAGSLALRGALLDDMVLNRFRQSVQPECAPVRLLSEPTQERPFFIRLGWRSQKKELALPDETTVWATSSPVLTPEKPVTLTWKNAQGVIFERVISVDRNFLLTVRQRLLNKSGTPLTVQAFASIEGQASPEVKGQWVVHEGAVGFLNGRLEEKSFEDLQKGPPASFSGTGGWAGITEKYWLVAFLTDAATSQKTTYRYHEDRQRYEVETQEEDVTVPSEGTLESVTHFYIGAKDVQLLDGYESQLGVKHFDLAIDFGYFYFLTRPLFYALVYMKNLLEGHMGGCIIILTILIKLLLFPLANKSYRSMSRMRRIQPQVQEVQNRYKEDKERLSQELMALYKKEHVNPVGGCLPQLIQFPVLFALYKVFLVSIDMRHAPLWWVKDLSAPDPLWITNAFGWIAWTPTEFLQIGIWPLLMGITGLIQQKMSPPPADPAQAKMFLLMPVMFTFMLAQLPAGLVMYWTWSNVLSIVQQWIITRIEERRQLRSKA
ncbi:MAG: membrane protein insertase YidC [Holosporales bacterium]|nr:membrane protein insertase YidC [Holosporales bacterium]